MRTPIDMTPPRRIRTRLAALLVVALMMGLVPATVANAGEPNYSWRMFKATNQSRLRHGLPRLERNKESSLVAWHHSRRMAERNDLFHSTNVSNYLTGVGRWRSWGENIGYTPGEIDGLQRAFMNSPAHRANVLSRSFRHVAVGAYKQGGKIWVTVFFYG
jgi:uncharacterized protein YkwD